MSVEKRELTKKRKERKRKFDYEKTTGQRTLNFNKKKETAKKLVS